MFKTTNQDVLVFEYGELIGFEELLRHHILELNKELYFKNNGNYNTTDIENIKNY